MKNMMKKFIAIALAAATLATCTVSLASCGSDKTYTVGICQIAKHDALDAATKGFKDALIAELGEENVVFDEQNAQGETTACTTIVNNFVTKKVDLILANATAPLAAAYNATETIPILGTSITDYASALNLTNFNGTVGGNVSGTSDLAPISGQADMIAELFPSATKVALLFCSAESNSAFQISEMESQLAKKSIDFKRFSFSDSNDVASVAASAASWGDVIYIPTDNTAASCATTIDGAIGNTPVIAGEENICAKCGVAALTISYYDLGAQTGKMAAKVLKGEAKISEMKVEYADKFTKKYNAAKCTALGITVPSGYVAIEG